MPHSRVILSVAVAESKDLSIVPALALDGGGLAFHDEILRLRSGYRLHFAQDDAAIVVVSRSRISGSIFGALSPRSLNRFND